MKKFILTITIIFSAYMISSAQTTQEEYNYVTSGYKSQVANGLDMKKGYTLKDLNTSTSTVSGTTRTVSLKGLYRTSTNVLCAIMIIYTKSGGDSEYLCAPMTGTSQDIYDLYFASLYNESISTNQNDRLRLIAYALSALCFKL